MTEFPPWYYVVLAAVIFAPGTIPAVRDCWVFRVLPTRAERMVSRGDIPAAIALLERVAESKVWAGGWPRQKPRYRLALLYLQADRYEDARAGLERLLDELDRWPNHTGALVSEIRSRLLTCLEETGKLDEAARERVRIEQSRKDEADIAEQIRIESPPKGDAFHQRLCQAETCEAHGDTAGAAAAYEDALALAPPDSRERVATRLHLASALCGTERWAEALTQAQAVLTEAAPDDPLRLQAHLQATEACQGLDRIDEADAHHRQAIDLAVSGGHTRQAEEYLHFLALSLLQRGQSTAALELCERARRETEYRLIGPLHADCLRCLGRFDEARAVLEAVSASNPPPPFSAAILLCQANVEAEAGDTRRASAFLDQVAAASAPDTRRGLWCAAMRAWVQALEGEADAARRQREAVEERIAVLDTDEDLRTLGGCLYALALSAYYTRDDERSLAFWQSYLQTDPFPVDLPAVWFYTGESRFRQGDREGARTAFAQAISMDLDAYLTRRAAERLKEMRDERREDT